MTTQEQQAKDALDMIAYVSRLLRQGIANSLPVSGDQYLTVAIPGTIIDTRDVSEGGSYVWTPTKTKDPLTPLAVQQAEAKLVDGMMPLATVIVGNTGRSVSRSYNRALDLLVPLKSAGSPGCNDPSDPRFTKAMDYLRSTDDVGRSPIDYYIAKQTAWQEAQSEWDSAKQDAHSGFLRQYPGGKPEDIAAIQQAMNEWNQVNFRKYKTNVQGKWMDWVTRGNKYEVENSFGVVDIESIMARIEESKESWRNSTIVDEDGANELQSVRLTPRNWAQLCQDKVTQWRATNGGYSYEQLEAEIEPSSFSQSKSSSSWGMSVSGGVNYGLFRLGGAYSHEEGKSEMYQDMAKCDVAISFDAMVVNINRPWLYGELFGDYELNVADGIKLSPGPEQLQQWLTDVKNNAKVLGEWTQFPSYPTSFVVAANTIIEFTGSTSHIEQHFSFHSNSGSISVGFGPFSMSGSFHEEAQNANVQMQATATGCKIAFGSPQIIAWTSQILPQLPRPKDFDPLVTNFV
ncbi:uncharacterized protein K444DRAFT_722797 [Hyaloscypha bicolor E]|uniref:Uncharacterized protein n=1 Tax=Hyaloscypha bicolor E TaxID=1095630 RepID=A0A2J6TA89_9HELO|nr:uncharacterized protein K444DRAFT_722797 [Hyaloscypha bicolor E]PMD59936.1 hypothetical protein K444DRAFT_722797 [Hyaloscypha bicolor E]